MKTSETPPGAGLGGRVLYEFGGFRLDPAARALSNADGEALAMTGKAFDALVVLVEHAGELVERRVLFAALWPRTVVEDNNLNQAILAARRALGDGRGGQRYIATVPGRGYQFVAAVRRVETEAPVPSNAFEPGIDPDAEGAKPAPGRAIKSALRARHVRAAAAMAVALPAAVLLAAAGLALYGRSGGGASAEDAPLGAVAEVSPVTTFAGDEHAPSVSPDGAFVAFIWEGGASGDGLYAMRIGSQQPIKLADFGAGPIVDPAAWSPDGKRLALLRRRSPTDFDLRVIDAQGGAEQTVGTVQIQTISQEGAPRLAWTQDGRALLTTNRTVGADGTTYPIEAFDLATGEVRALTYAARAYDTSPALSPDGRRLAFTRYDLGKRLPTLMIQPLDREGLPDGSPSAVPNVPPGLVWSPAWSPDGATLTFVINQRIFEWRDGRDPRIVYAGDGSLGMLALAWHEGQARAVAVKLDTDRDVWELELDPRTHAAVGSAERRIRSTAPDYHPQVSPDGRALAFVSRRSGKSALWLSTLTGAEQRQLTFLDSDVTGYPSWAQDGRRLAFHASLPGRKREIYAVDAAEGVEQRLFEGCCPRWSRDGEHLYVTDVAAADDANMVARVRVADGRRERLFIGELAVETPDGRRLLYAKELERGIFARSLDGDVRANPEERLVDDYTPALGGIVPVADGFFYLGHTPEGTPRAFRFYDFATGAARDVAPAPPTTTSGLTITPDGRRLLYGAGVGERGADLVLFQFR